MGFEIILTKSPLYMCATTPKRLPT